LPPSAAEFYIASAVDSLILRSKINESTADANDYLVRSADKILLHHTYPQNFSLPQTAFKLFSVLCTKLHLQTDICPRFREAKSGTNVRLKRTLCRRRRQLTPKTASFPNYFLARSAKK
jgi:hypothetical protein